MSGYVTDIEQATLENEDFRRVFFTGRHLQLVLMTLRPDEEIGLERHGDPDQFVRVESGEGEVVLDGEGSRLRDGSVVVVPAGSSTTSSTPPLPSRYGCTPCTRRPNTPMGPSTERRRTPMSTSARGRGTSSRTPPDLVRNSG